MCSWCGITLQWLGYFPCNRSLALSPSLSALWKFHQWGRREEGCGYVCKLETPTGESHYGKHSSQAKETSLGRMAKMFFQHNYKLINVDVKSNTLRPLRHDLGFFPSIRAASAKHIESPPFVSLLRFFHCNYTWPRGSRCPNDHPYRMSALMAPVRGSHP